MARRLVVDLRLDRGPPRAAEDEDDAERGEAEEERQRGGGRQGRRQLGQRHLAGPPERPRPEHGRGFGARGIDRRPRPADDARDDRDVEEDVGGEDRPEAPLVALRQQLQERGRDDDRRQHERHQHERPRERAAAEPKAPDHPREGQAGGKREHGRRGRLPGREPEQLGRAGGQREAAVRGEAALEDRGERVREEERHEGRGHERGGDVPGAAQRRTACVHSSIQRSRFAPISSDGRSNGSSGEGGIATEGRGQRRPLAHRQHEHALG